MENGEKVVKILHYERALDSAWRRYRDNPCSDHSQHFPERIRLCRLCARAPVPIVLGYWNYWTNWRRSSAAEAGI